MSFALVSALLMRNTIMTEKLARRGVRVPSEYAADHLDTISVGDACATEVVYLRSDQTLEEVRRWAADKRAETTHQGFPVLDANGDLVGVITRRDFMNDLPGTTTIAQIITRPPSVVFPDHSLREAADHMVRENLGRLPVVSRENPRKVVGFITRSDLLKAHEKRLADSGI